MLPKGHCFYLLRAPFSCHFRSGAASCGLKGPRAHKSFTHELAIMPAAYKNHETHIISTKIRAHPLQKRHTTTHKIQAALARASLVPLPNHSHTYNHSHSFPSSCPYFTSCPVTSVQFHPLASTRMCKQSFLCF